MNLSLRQLLKFRPCLEVLEARNLLSNAALLPNVSVNNPAEDVIVHKTQSETSTAVANDGTIISAFNDSEENVGILHPHSTGYAFSTDGGKTFTDAGGLPESDNGDGGDPMLAVNQTNGNVYLTTLDFFGDPVVQFYTSTDSGRTFGAPVNAFPNLPVNDFLDKPWMTVDNSEGRGNGTIYVTATDFGDTSINLLVSESKDNGATWQQQQLAQGAVQGSNVVAANHKAYAFWWDANQSPTERIMMTKSDNKGEFGSTATTVATLRTTGVDGSLGLDFRTNAFPQAAVNPNDPNTVYLVYNDVGQAPGDRGDIYFTQTNNGGKSWTSPVKLNDDTTSADQFFPTITVTPDGSHMFVTWYDRRNAATPNGNIERFGVIGSIDDNTVTFGHNFDYSDAPFPEVFGHDPAVAPDYMGDYDQATSDNHNFYTSFVDTRRGNQDVFFEKIPVPGDSSGPETPWLVVHGSPGDGAQAMSPTNAVRGPSLPTSIAPHDAVFANLGQSLAPALSFANLGLSLAPASSFANLGQFLAPASSATDALGHASASVAGRQSESVAAPILAAPPTVGSDAFQVNHHSTGDAPADDMVFLHQHRRPGDFAASGFTFADAGIPPSGLT
jgi:hypothetical protein